MFVSSHPFSPKWQAMLGSLAYHLRLLVDPLVRLGRKLRIKGIVSIANPTAQASNLGSLSIANLSASPVVDPIYPDPSTWQVLNIVHPGGNEGNSFSLKDQTGPIHPSILPAHEDDEILVRARVSQNKPFCPDQPKQRCADLEHSSFICLVPVILAAIALLLAGSFIPRDSCLIGSMSSCSQNTISTDMTMAQVSFDSSHSVGVITARSKLFSSHNLQT